MVRNQGEFSVREQQTHGTELVQYKNNTAASTIEFRSQSLLR